MKKTVIAAQKTAIKHLRCAITTFVKGRNKTRVIPLAIPTGWGKTRIAIQAVLQAEYKKTPPVIVIWPQKHSHISKEVWRRAADWCKKKCKNCGNDEFCTKKVIPPIRYLKPGSIINRHEANISNQKIDFRGVFYSVNNNFEGIINELDKTKGPIIFIIDEWHSKNLIEKYCKSGFDDAELFWRDFLIGRRSSRKLFVILISATPIGVTSHMDSISDDESEGKYKENIENAIKSFNALTKVGNQKRKYNIYHFYETAINKEVKRLEKEQKECEYKPKKNTPAWIKSYINLGEKAYSNKKQPPSPPSLIYSLETLLLSGVSYNIVKEHHCDALKSYFMNGFKKIRETLKLRTTLELLNQYKENKFVVFCCHIAVAKCLEKYLIKHKIPAYYLAGDVSKSDKHFIAFNEDDGNIRVLIVTDQHSQGISLHKTKAWLLHFELSWNPIRIIQRFGRVWRIDQNSKKLTTPLAFHMPHAFSSEEEMLSRLKRRWKVLEDISGTEHTNFVNLAPLSFRVALGKRCSPSISCRS